MFCSPQSIYGHVIVEHTLKFQCVVEHRFIYCQYVTSQSTWSLVQNPSWLVLFVALLLCFDWLPKYVPLLWQHLQFCYHLFHDTYHSCVEKWPTKYLKKSEQTLPWQSKAPVYFSNHWPLKLLTTILSNIYKYKYLPYIHMYIYVCFFSRWYIISGLFRYLPKLKVLYHIKHHKTTSGGIYPLSPKQ